LAEKKDLIFFVEEGRNFNELKDAVNSTWGWKNMVSSISILVKRLQLLLIQKVNVTDFGKDYLDDEMGMTHF